MKKSLQFVLLLLVATSLSLCTLGGTALARLTECDGPCPSNGPGSQSPGPISPGSGSGTGSKEDLVSDARCTTTETATCATLKDDPALSEDCRVDAAACNPVYNFINPLINTLAVLAGVAVAAGIIIGGIQYASSGGDPQKAATGKNHIKMAVVALIGFFFMYAFLQFLIPGGILTR